MMKRLLTLICLSLLSAASLADVVDVSLIKLIATPQDFDGKRVRLIGFVRLEFEGDSIYLHKEDCLRRITRNGLWLDVALPEKQKARVNNRYAIVEGVFSMETGHLGLWSGSIKNVTRIDPWRAE